MALARRTTAGLSEEEYTVSDHSIRFLYLSQEDLIDAGVFDRIEFEEDF